MDFIFRVQFENFEKTFPCETIEEGETRVKYLSILNKEKVLNCWVYKYYQTLV